MSKAKERILPYRKINIDYIMTLALVNTKQERLLKKKKDECIRTHFSFTIKSQKIAIDLTFMGKNNYVPIGWSIQFPCDLRLEMHTADNPPSLVRFVPLLPSRQCLPSTTK